MRQMGSSEKVFTQWAHHGQTTFKQRRINVLYVETTLFKRRLTMISLLNVDYS